MSLYTERDPVKLREIAVALCVETAKRSSTHTSAQLTRVAEETVPPVPTPEPEYHTYKGVTYRDGSFVCPKGNAYSMAASVVVYVDDLHDDDHAALMALKANPVKVATSDAPDKDCVTLADGSCVSEKHCMHGPPLSAGRREMLTKLLRDVWDEVTSVTDAVDRIMLMLSTTPATVASDPEFDYDTIQRAYDVIQKQVGSHALDFYTVNKALKAAQLHRHPATEAEALAMLVGLGAVLMKGCDGIQAPEYARDGTWFRRLPYESTILILPRTESAT